MLAIIWHSRTGAAQALAQAAQAGAARGGPVRLIAAADAVPDALLDAGGYLFCCPENLGTMTGAMKEFFDRAYYPLLGRIEGRPYATIIAAGSDGEGALRQIDRIVTGWRLRRVADPLVALLEAQTPERILAPKTVPHQHLAAAEALGEALSRGLGMGIF
jgi:multimeric flavodoxin WrbA